LACHLGQATCSTSYDGREAAQTSAEELHSPQLPIEERNVLDRAIP
jgi:hypothetical protein